MLKSTSILLLAGLMTTGAASMRAEAPVPRVVKQQMAGDTIRDKYYWTDELVFHDWRIQRHADNGRYRLLDGESIEHASGRFDDCQHRLDEIKRQRKLPAVSGQVVLVLHGLGRTRLSNDALVDYLREKTTHTVLSVGYASTREDVAAHARALSKVIDNLGDQVTEMNFVAHSLGNLVIRRYMAEQRDAAGHCKHDPRIKRIVMVGPPNNGARMAKLVGRSELFEKITGESGRALARDWDTFCKSLCTPDCEFGIIAGGRGDGAGYNPLLLGDDDLVIGVEEAKLPGARDFTVIEGMHAWMMLNPAVHAAALRFLEHGYFISEERRQPLK
jgi:pimeloyl-ACP methyl ester carboxylesterase